MHHASELLRNPVNFPLKNTLHPESNHFLPPGPTYPLLPSGRLSQPPPGPLASILAYYSPFSTQKWCGIMPLLYLEPSMGSHLAHSNVLTTVRSTRPCTICLLPPPLCLGALALAAVSAWKALPPAHRSSCPLLPFLQVFTHPCDQNFPAILFSLATCHRGTCYSFTYLKYSLSSLLACKAINTEAVSAYSSPVSGHRINLQSLSQR